MNALIFLEEGHANHFALVPYERVKSYDWDRINNKTVNNDQLTEDDQDAIVDLFRRFGLEKNDNPDLEQFLDPKPPFAVDFFFKIGWLT